MKEVWRGWQGHHICDCKWHLNTLLELDGYKLIVSTVGKNFDKDGKPETVGHNRFFETMVFESAYDEWDDPDVNCILDFCAGYQDEKEAQQGHYDILKQVKDYMINRMISQ